MREGRLSETRPRGIATRANSGSRAGTGTGNVQATDFSELMPFDKIIKTINERPEEDERSRPELEEAFAFPS